MHRIIAAALTVLCILSVAAVPRRCARTEPEPEPSAAVETSSAGQTAPEIHAVWISYMELSLQNEADKSEAAFRAKAQTMMQRLSSFGIDTAFVHVRAFSDAFYRSDVFPFSAYLTGRQGSDPGYDPLAILCEQAALWDVDIHAWINPFRISASEDQWAQTAADNPARRFLSDDYPDNDHCVVHTAGGVYYDPASPDVASLLIRGVQEILSRYPVAGVHIDDYFYPSQEEQIDRTEYERYRNAGGNAALDEWRRGVVSAWVRQMYDAVKAFGSDKVFSISPAAGIGYNRDTLYADVEVWCAEAGYCDWIIPQLYLGFENENNPFDKAAARWNALAAGSPVTLVYALSPYKCGQADEYAGTGRTEWIEREDILARQIDYCRTLPRCGGFAFFSYSYIFGEKIADHAKKELKNVTSVL